MTFFYYTMLVQYNSVIVCLFIWEVQHKLVLYQNANSALQ